MNQQEKVKSVFKKYMESKSNAEMLCDKRNLQVGCLVLVALVLQSIMVAPIAFSHGNNFGYSFFIYFSVTFFVLYYQLFIFLYYSGIINES